MYYTIYVSDPSKNSCSIAAANGVLNKLNTSSPISDKSYPSTMFISWWVTAKDSGVSFGQRVHATSFIPLSNEVRNVHVAVFSTCFR